MLGWAILGRANQTQKSQQLSGFFKADLPGRRLGAKTALGAGAEPVAELRRNIPERSVCA
jgi:hypothetical protein